jgi:trimeric autotransporter adhesin
MKTSRIKFPRRVRIHGGECGAVARALHHKAKSLSLPAVKKKVFSTTNERKQMSTKTTLKRVALVAVSALGFGLVTAVAPANAAAENLNTKVRSVVNGTNDPARVGVTTRVRATVRVTEVVESGDTITVGARAVSAPTGSKYAAYDGTATEIEVSEVTSYLTNAGSSAGTYTDGNGLEYAQASNVFTFTATAATAKATSAGFYIEFTPDKAGTYEFLIWAGGTTWTASYKSTSNSITTVGKPATMSLTKYGVVTTGNTDHGALILLTLKDANGAVTRLGSGEGIAITSSSTAVATYISDANGDFTEEVTGLDYEAELAGLEILGAGAYHLMVLPDGASEDGSAVITFTGSGTLATANILQNTTVSIVATEDSTDAKFTLTDSTGYYCDDTTGPGLGCKKNGGASHGITMTLGTWAGDVFTAQATADFATAATKYPVKLTSGGLSFGGAVSVAANKGSGTITLSGTAGTYSVGITAFDGDGSMTISYSAPAVTTLSLLQSTTIRSAAAGTIALSGRVLDQYGAAMANQGVTVSVTGRNSKSATLATDSLGKFSYSYVDAGTLAVTDLVTFTSVTDDTKSSSATTVIIGATTVGSVAVTGGSTAETVAGTVTSPISTGDGAEGG